MVYLLLKMGIFHGYENCLLKIAIFHGYVNKKPDGKQF